MHEAVSGQKKDIRLVLFDLDGTFADTAPDLAYALNQTLLHHGREPLPYERIRPHVSHGGIALVKLGFEIEQEHKDFERYRHYLLDVYRENISRETSLFPGMEDVLQRLESSHLDWGIVTNKPAWLTDPLMQDLGLDTRASCIVSGDTTTNRKPHPEPILHACKLAGHRADECLYIGDAERDIEAGRNAGTATLTALFGYIGDKDMPEQWGADGSVESPEGILDWLGLAPN
jgi:2-phosphoglycolate phosphatase